MSRRVDFRSTRSYLWLCTIHLMALHSGEMPVQLKEGIGKWMNTDATGSFAQVVIIIQSLLQNSPIRRFFSETGAFF